jgi:hypothetical protein
MTIDFIPKMRPIGPTKTKWRIKAANQKPTQFFHLTDATYNARWPESIYTTLGYFRIVHKARGLRFRSKSAKTKKAPVLPTDVKENIRIYINQMDNQNLKALYQFGSGDCSAWAVWVSARVEEQSQDSLRYIS